MDMHQFQKFRQDMMNHQNPSPAVAATLLIDPSLNRPNQRYSLEQARFQDRIKNASQMMDIKYLQQMKMIEQTEKEKFAQRLEQRS